MGRSPEVSRLYRELIDRLVHDCREGQGTLRSERVRAGNTLPFEGPPDEPEWITEAADPLRAQNRREHDLLSHTSQADREVIAAMLEDSFSAGIHAALVALTEYEIEPFHSGQVNSPFHDFVGRLEDWPWPDEL